jgi:putative ABC transport system permease protein
MRDETLHMAVQVLVRNPARSALTVLGLAIGVAAFIAMLSFGQGARRSVLSQFENLGSNILRVRNKGSIRDAVSRPPRLLLDRDVRALTRESTAVSEVVPLARRLVDFNRGPVLHRTILVGTVPAYTVLHDWRTSAGGMFDAGEDALAKKVCVLGATPAVRLFGDQDPIGNTITVAGKFPCRVVGVLASKGQSISGSDIDDTVLMPVQTFRLFLGVPDGYSWIELAPTRPEWLEAARAEATEIIRRTHGLTDKDVPDFDVVSPDDVTRAADQTAAILTGLLAGIAAVSLLVGGIGIMNIQLVSVVERTHEIGIRAAIGASPAQILRHFLVESCVLSLFGSTVGIIAGVITAVVVASAMGWPTTLSLATVLGAGSFGVAVGVIFGYAPARRAANLDPIEALRRE